MKGRCFVLLLLAVFVSHAWGSEVSKIVTLEELEYLTLKVGGVKFNNFCLVEQKLLDEQTIKAKVNARTKDMKEKYTPAAVYLSATDSAGKLVACFSIKEVFGLKPNDSQELSDWGTMPIGQLKHIQKIQIRVIVEE